MSFRILSIGEVLWDLLPAEPVLGGAPSNFALHAHGLGTDAKLVSRVGEDSRGREILEQLRARGMETDLIASDNALPTGTVTVTLTDDGQPCYVIHEHVAWDAITITAECERAATASHAVCFGTLAQRSPASRAAVQALVAASPPDALRVFDINLRQHFFSRDVIESSLSIANVLKLNETELPVLAELFGLCGKAKAQLTSLAERFRLRAIAFTRGAEGSCLMADGIWSERAAAPTAVRDTVGAGDSFAAAFVLGMLAQWSLPAIHERASEVAAFVCSQTGPTPPLPERFLISSRQIPA